MRQSAIDPAITSDLFSGGHKSNIYSTESNEALRCRPSSRVRRTALWEKMWRKREDVISAMSRRVSDMNSAEGEKSGCGDGTASALCGHTNWHVSQPYTRLPTTLATHPGSSPRRSMSWHDRHRRASTALPSCNAPPGHATAHRSQPAHESEQGSSGSNSRVVTSSPRKKNEPRPGMMSILFRPIKPNPARRAQ